MAYTNTSPICYPTRSANPALGTNPLALGAPGVNGDNFVLDMATTTVAIGKVGLLFFPQRELDRIDVLITEQGRAHAEIVPPFAMKGL